MKFTVLTALVAVAQAQDAGLQLGTASSGALNYMWTDYMQCPDFTTAENQVEFAVYGTNTDPFETFENFKQTCAEAAYGWDAESAPCIGVMYIPGGFNYLEDGTGSDTPFYGCGAFLGEYLVEAEKNNADHLYLQSLGANLDDENNRAAACINDSPANVKGAYSCSRGPLLIGAEYLTLGAAAALSVAAMI